MIPSKFCYSGLTVATYYNSSAMFFETVHGLSKLVEFFEN